VKKLTTGKIWQFAAGQFGWAMLSGIISNWLVYFYQPDKTAISQGQTVFIPQGLVVFGIFTIIGGITAFGRIFDAFTDPMIASLSDRCTSKNGRRIPFLKWASLPLALSTVLVFWSPVNKNSWINGVFLLIMILAPIAAALIQMAVSRSREYMADEGGGELSGDPDALADALLKIDAYAQRRTMPGATEATAHMFIVCPFSRKTMQQMFSTHPSTEERVARLREQAAEMRKHGGR